MRSSTVLLCSLCAWLGCNGSLGSTATFDAGGTEEDATAQAEDSATPDPDVSQPDTAGPPKPMLEAVVDKAARAALLDLIANAKKTLDVFEFEFIQSGSVKNVLQAVLDAKNRGVSVRVFCDDSVADTQTTIDTLTQAGIAAKTVHLSFTSHIKVMIADRSDMLLGSTNLSGASIDYNHEANTRVRDAKAVGFVADYLDQIWNNPKLHPATKTLAQDGAPSVWLDGGYNALVLPVVNAATKTIDLVIYTIAIDPKYPSGPLPDLLDALASAQKRGVVVRVLMEQASNDTTGVTTVNKAAATALKAKNINVRFDDPSTVTHAKALVVDGKTAFVGSNNWAYGGLVENHEGGVMTTDTTVVGDLQAYFNAQWGAGK